MLGACLWGTSYPPTEAEQRPPYAGATTPQRRRSRPRPSPSQGRTQRQRHRSPAPLCLHLQQSHARCFDAASCTPGTGVPSCQAPPHCHLESGVCASSEGTGGRRTGRGPRTGPVRTAHAAEKLSSAGITVRSAHRARQMAMSDTPRSASGSLAASAARRRLLRLRDGMGRRAPVLATAMGHGPSGSACQLQPKKLSGALLR